MPNVKVSIDQWAVTTIGKADLFTDGLSGCVALCLESTVQIGLTHVFAGSQNESDWDSCKENIRLMVIVMNSVSPITHVTLVYSDDHTNLLVTALTDCLPALGVALLPVARKASGCRLMPGSYFRSTRKSKVMKKEDDIPFTSLDYLPVSMAGGLFLDNWGKLRDSAIDCDPFGVLS